MSPYRVLSCESGMYHLLIQRVSTVTSEFLQYQARVWIGLNRTGCRTNWFIYIPGTFRRISLLAWDNNLVFRSCNLFQILSLILLSSLILDFPTRVGKPKYLSYLYVLGTPYNRIIQSRASWLVFQLKKIDVFSFVQWLPRGLFIAL